MSKGGDFKFGRDEKSSDFYLDDQTKTITYIHLNIIMENGILFI